ncbi:MAG: hypothetical protein GY774_36235 [Planctomycetes bacterium]|nr:hypothetical protein [Planctomycetota bacterium]
MNIKIIGTVTDEHRLPVQVIIHSGMIEQLIEDTAKKLKIKPFKGRMREHYTPTVIKVEIDD